MKTFLNVHLISEAHKEHSFSGRITAPKENENKTHQFTETQGNCVLKLFWS